MNYDTWKGTDPALEWLEECEFDSRDVECAMADDSVWSDELVAFMSSTAITE